MPRAAVTPKYAWYPGRDIPLTAERALTLEMGQALPEIVSNSWNNLGTWGGSSPGGVVPDITEPPLITTLATADWAIKVMPNFTPERFAEQEAFRAALIKEILAWLAKNCKGIRPTIDVDVDFTMGCGAFIDSQGVVKDTWPDELKK